MKFYEASHYQNRCKKLFKFYKSEIHKILPSSQVEHIGASSIEGALSKGDLDVYIGIEPLQLEDAVKQLKTLNFKVKEDTLKTAELCMLESKNGEVAFQVVANGSKFRFFLEFRDKLRNSTKLLKQYNQLKQDCCGLKEDEYRKRKSRFIESVLDG